jgi:hypothetical protein
MEHPDISGFKPEVITAATGWERGWGEENDSWYDGEFVRVVGDFGPPSGPKNFCCTLLLVFRFAISVFTTSWPVLVDGVPKPLRP